MIDIKLPKIHWFLFGNVYTGSCGTDPLHGCMHIETFNYKAYISHSFGSQHLFAAHYICAPWNIKPDREILTIGRFDASALGVWEAEKWLTEDVAMFLLKRSTESIELDSNRRICGRASRVSGFLEK